jgi:hypothetical protein
MADEEKKLTPLEEANRREREIILQGREDPDNFKMPDGTTLTETRKRIYEQQIEEGRETEKIQSQRIREQSIENDPLYNSNATVVDSGIGGATILPAPTQPPEEGSGPKDSQVKEEPAVMRSSPIAHVDIPTDPERLD